MGQVCSGTKEESSKAGGLLDVPNETDVFEDASSNNPQQQQQQQADSSLAKLQQQQQAAPSPTEDSRLEASQKLAALQEAEQQRKRKELWIVNGAARGMVAVRSTRGSTGYYDQGFAGLLAQHLEQTTSFPDRLPLRLPPSAAGSKIQDRLSQPAWEGMVLAINIIKDDDNNANANNDALLQGREAAAAVSGDPHQLMDALAESLLDGPYTVLPEKQQLFAGVLPMVENLL